MTIWDILGMVGTLIAMYAVLELIRGVRALEQDTNRERRGSR